jgi:hypothetical protein
MGGLRAAFLFGGCADHYRRFLVILKTVMRATGAHDFPRRRESKFVALHQLHALATCTQNWVPACAGTTS